MVPNEISGHSNFNRLLITTLSKYLNKDIHSNKEDFEVLSHKAEDLFKEATKKSTTPKQPFFIFILHFLHFFINWIF